MSRPARPDQVKIWTATELRALPPAQRDAILAAAATIAERDYRDDSDLTAFEAFDEDSSNGESVHAEAR